MMDWALAEPARSWLLIAALGVDAAVGEPAWLWRRLPHPIVLMGRLVGRLDRRLNRDGHAAARRRLMGVAAVLALLASASGLGWALAAAAALPYGWLAEIAVVAVLLAQRSLFEHVGAVAAGLGRSLEEGRQAVAMIVGRDPAVLDEAGVARAAVESTAENYSDGVVAPAFWYLVLGLPGIVAYKALNTADSMIGHRTPRHEAFGWAAARLDDLANLIPARLTALLILPASLAVRRRGGGPVAALRAAWRDAGKHRSPNAGWPEAATAGALGLALAGPRRYGAHWVADPYMNAGGDPAAGPADIRAAIRLLALAGALGCIALAIGGLAIGGLAIGGLAA
jgi:adenosylcobinamide-phosphate synthase